MTGELSFWNIEIWSFIIMLSVLFVAMMFANLLRRTIKPLGMSLIPSAVLAGFLLLIVNEIVKKVFGTSLFDTVTLESLTYHGLGLGVVAMTYRNVGDEGHSRKGRIDIFNSGILTVSTYLIQAVLGLGITLGLSYVIGNWAAAGILLPMGFGQGPGNAYGWGVTYQTATDYPAFANGASFGLSVAAMGFIAASIGGVIYLNMMKRKGKIKLDGTNEEAEDLSAEKITSKGEIPIAESLDKLTVQFGLIFLAYILAYIFSYVVSLGLDKAGGFLEQTVKPLLWNFNFLVGMLFVFIIKSFMRLFKKHGLMRREYVNNFMMNRISGLMFDIMVVASIAAINLSAFKYREFIIPLLLICIVGGVASFFYVKFVTEKLFPEYRDEQFLMFYGMLTGTNSTGFTLLREVDPFYKTPAAKNLIYQNLWAVLFGAPMLLLMGFAARSMRWTWITWGLLVAFLVIMLLILFRTFIFRRKKKDGNK